MQPRIRIRPSFLGTKALLLCLLEVAFLATDYSNLFFLLLAFSAVVGLSGALWSYRNVRGLSVSALTVAPAPAGEPRAFAVDVTTRSATPRFGIEIRLPDLGDDEVAYQDVIVGRATIATQLPPRPRGLVALGRVRLTSRYPFGFFVAQLTVPSAAELVTYPQPAPTRTERAGGSVDDGEHLGGNARGATLAGLRAFRTGDPLNDVHWKATARRGRAIVKEREPEGDRRTLVRLDRRCDDEALERALPRLAALVLAARHGAPLHIVSQDVDLQVDPERGGNADALRFLAAATTLPAEAPPPPAMPGAIALPERGRR